MDIHVYYYYFVLYLIEIQSLPAEGICTSFQSYSSEENLFAFVTIGVNSLW